MVNKAYAIATGAFVLLLIAGTAAMAVWLSGYRVERVPYVLVSQHSVMGLSPQATVYYRGVPVGTVDSVDFDHSDFRNILVRIEVEPEVPITRGTYGILQPQGITGVANVQLDDSGRDPRRLPTSASSPGRIPLQPSTLDTLLVNGKLLLARLSRLAADLDQLTNAENRTHFAHTLANMDRATRQLPALEEQLRSALTVVPDIGRDLHHTLGDINVVTQRLQRLSGSLDELARSATELTKTGNGIGEDLRVTTVPRLDRLLLQMNGAIRQLQQLTATLQQDPQSLLYGRPSPPPGPGEAKQRK